MVGFKAIRLGTALKYLAHIKRYTQRCSASVWSIVYQADARCRRELLDRVHRAISAKIAEADAVSRQTADEVAKLAKCDRTMPWDYCVQGGKTDQPFWKVEVEEAAMLVLSKASHLQDMVGGDARTST